MTLMLTDRRQEQRSLRLYHVSLQGHRLTYRLMYRLGY